MSVSLTRLDKNTFFCKESIIEPTVNRRRDFHCPPAGEGLAASATGPAAFLASAATAGTCRNWDLFTLNINSNFEKLLSRFSACCNQLSMHDFSILFSLSVVSLAGFALAAGLVALYQRVYSGGAGAVRIDALFPPFFSSRRGT